MSRTHLMAPPPILLIHYGNSSYLPYVIKIAKRFNPAKEIILLGDQHNEHLASLGISHHRFEPLRASQDLATFNRLYPRIVNPKYPKSRWARFVLQRWFIINSFITRENIEAFWTFDSDNFILTDLGQYEEQLSGYDCTSQCSGRCMNGFVSNTTIVQRYVNRINDLLSDDQYVRNWHLRYAENPALFYNEMEAFAVFAELDQLRNFHLAQIRDGAMFDDSITYDNGMAMYERTIKGRRVKRLYLLGNEVYCQHLETEAMIRMNNLNLSWMPKYIFPLLFDHIVCGGSPHSFTFLDLSRAPWSYHMKWFIRNRIPKPVRDHISRGAYWV